MIRATFARTAGGRWSALVVGGALAALACATVETTQPNPGGGPVAAAGSDQTVSAELPVRLDGTGSSDPAGGSLTYQWSLGARPAGSAAVLDDPAAGQPSFIPDVPGTYRLSLVVSAGAVTSPADEVVVTAEDHTASATVGAAGGLVVSLDGRLTVTFPPGALASATDVDLIRVLPDQYPDPYRDLPEEAGVFALLTGGVAATGPVTVFARLPDPLENAAGDLEASLWVFTQLVPAAGTAFAPTGPTQRARRADVIAPPEVVDFLSDQAMSALPSQDYWGLTAQAVPASPQAASFIAFSRALVGSGDFEEQIVFTVHVPDDFPSTDTTDVRISLVTADPVEWQGLTAAGSVTVTQTDATGGGLLALDPFDPVFDWFGDTYSSFNRYTCVSPGLQDFGSDLYLGINQIGRGFLAGKVFGSTVEFRRQVDCTDSSPPFEAHLAVKPEGGAVRMAPGAVEFFWTEEGGGRHLNATGVTLETFEGVPTTETSIGAMHFNFNSTSRRFGFFGSDGLRISGGFGFSRADGARATAQSVVPLTRPNLVVPGITDNTGTTTDGMGYGNDPDAPGWLLTQFEDRNILFLVPSAGDVMVDPALAQTFYDNGQSIFGTARPVSAYSGPNGFTASDPMLVVTVADDGSGAGEVLKLDLVSGTAVPRVVTEVFVQPEPRRIRCLAGICAASSFGTGGGFGGVMFFTWDGQDGFTFIVNRITNAIGIDLIQDGSRILVASTNFFQNTYTIDELTAAGSYVGEQTFPVPAGCEGPGHVVFRSTRDVVISCNTSGLVVGDVFVPM